MAEVLFLLMFPLLELMAAGNPVRFPAEKRTTNNVRPLFIPAQDGRTASVMLTSMQ